MKRPKSSSPVKGKPARCSDEKFARLYPTLTVWMTDGFWDDGKPRAVSSLSIKMGDGRVQVSLSDHDGQRSVYTDAETIEDALALLEAAIRDETCGWRSWKQGKGR